jgi:hypothetical protein
MVTSNLRIGRMVETNGGKVGKIIGDADHPIKGWSSTTYPVVVEFDGRPATYSPQGEWIVGEPGESDIYAVYDADIYVVEQVEDEEGYGFVHPPVEAPKPRRVFHGAEEALDALSDMGPWDMTREGARFWTMVWNKLDRICREDH